MELSSKEAICIANEQAYKQQLSEALSNAYANAVGESKDLLAAARRDLHGGEYGRRASNSNHYSSQIFAACMDDIDYRTLSVPGAKSFTPVAR